MLLFLLFPDTFGLMLDQVPSELNAAGAMEGVRSLPIEILPSQLSTLAQLFIKNLVIHFRCQSHRYQIISETR